VSTDGDFDGLRITPLDPADLPDESSSLVSVLVVGDDPIGFWWFEFTKGVTVLYGRNGVGKTKCLEALAHAGVIPGSDLGAGICGTETTVRRLDPWPIAQAMRSLRGVAGSSSFPPEEIPYRFLEEKCEEWGSPLPELLSWAFPFAEEDLVSIRCSEPAGADLWVASARREDLQRALVEADPGPAARPTSVWERVRPSPAHAEEERSLVAVLRSQMESMNAVQWVGATDSENVEDFPGDEPTWEDVDELYKPTSHEIVKYLFFGRHTASGLAALQHLLSASGELLKAPFIPLVPESAAVSVGFLGEVTDAKHSSLRSLCDPMHLHPDKSQDPSEESLAEESGEWIKRQLILEASDAAEDAYLAEWEKVETAGGDPALTVVYSDYFEAPLFKKGSWPVEINPRLEEFAHDLSQKANNIFGLLLEDPPELAFRISPPDLLTDQQPFTWVAIDLGSGDEFPLSGLSEAQLRWSKFAIRAALENEVHLVLIDEPERGLHRSGQRHLASGLQSLAERFDAPLVVASHSPELLRNPDSRLLHVRRNAQGRIDPVDFQLPTRDHLDELGLDLVDTLTLVKCFVVVEGDHDREVLRVLLGDELDGLGAQVVPMHGSNNLAATLDSQFMLDFTEAGIVVVLDNTSAEFATDLLVRVHQMVDQATTNELEAAVMDWAKKSKQDKTKEEKDLVEFFKTVALTANRGGRLDRISAFGFKKADVVDYLDCERLVPGQSDWVSLRTRHESHSGKVWKEWLKAEYGATFGLDDIREAARVVAQDPPAEFFDLLDVVRSVPRRSPAGF